MSNIDRRLELEKDIERIIAKHCYTTTGINNGKYYRYPVHYKKNGSNWVSKGNGTANVDIKSFSTLQYRFGVHRMDIGKAIEEIIELLETDCNLYADDYKNWEDFD